MTEVRTRRTAAVILAGLLVVLMSALMAGHAFAQADNGDNGDDQDNALDNGDGPAYGGGGGAARTFAVVAQPNEAVAPGAAAPALAAVPQGVAAAPAPMAAAPVPAAAPAAAPVPATAPAAPAATTATTVRTVTRAAAAPAPARRLGRTGSSTSTELLLSGLAFLVGGLLLLAASPLRRAQRQLI